jgi:hypothetical protein
VFVLDSVSVVLLWSLVLLTNDSEKQNPENGFGAGFTPNYPILVKSILVSL